MVSKISAWACGALITVLYAYMVIAGVGNILGMNDASALLQLPISGVGWWWLGFGTVLPIVSYSVALIVARTQSAWLRVMILAAGLCATAAVQLEVSHLVPGSIFFAG